MAGCGLAVDDYGGTGDCNVEHRAILGPALGVDGDFIAAFQAFGDPANLRLAFRGHDQGLQSAVEHLVDAVSKHAQESIIDAEHARIDGLNGQRIWHILKQAFEVMQAGMLDLAGGFAPGKWGQGRRAFDLVPRAFGQ